jgi:uncharacterized YigZ family protein
MAGDETRRPAREALAETRVRGSVFRARAFPVDTEADAQALLAALRRAEPDATHHCSAFRLPDDLARSDDDGEPSGTAGAPILRAIVGRDLVGALVVVTRWYGGTRLGTGGLVRAYGEAAALALDAAGVTVCVRRVAVRVRFAYPDTAAVQRTLARFDTEARDADYGADIVLTAAVRASQAGDFCAALTEATGGRAEVDVR